MSVLSTLMTVTSMLIVLILKVVTSVNADQDTRMMAGVAEVQPLTLCRLMISYLSLVCSCADINECAQGTDNCDDNAICINTVGSFLCRCRTGYEGDGTVCTGKIYRLR